MVNEIKEDGRAANIRGVSRNSNPYTSFEDTGKAVDWDLGWLQQTQHWAGRPKKMCKGKNCTAMRGVGHSEECIKERDDCANGIMPHFEI